MSPHRHHPRTSRVVGSLVAALSACAVAPQVGADVSFVGPIPSALPQGQTPITIKLGDLDGDGTLDAVVTGRNWDWKPGTTGRVAILKGAGDGTFAPWHELFVNEGDVEDAALVDLDGDRRLDLVVGVHGRDSRVASFRGLGAGDFSPPAYLSIHRDPRGLCAIEMDDDGDLDIVQTNYESGSLSLLRNTKGDLANVETVRLMRYLGGIPYPQSVVAVDLDGDRTKDLITTTLGAGRITVMRRLRAGGFGAPADWKPGLVNGEVPAVISSSIADFDGDGDQDAALPVLLITQSSKVVSLPNNGSGAFGAQTVSDTPGVGYNWCSAPLDFDGDGRVDLAVGTALTGTVCFMRNETAGPAQPIAFTFQWPFYSYGFFVRDIVSGDVDNDGDIDVVGIEIADSTIFTLLNENGGGKPGGVAGRGAKREGWNPTKNNPVTIDLTRDGKVDATDLGVWLGAWKPGATGGSR